MFISTNHVSQLESTSGAGPPSPINGLWRRTGGLNPLSPMLLDVVSRFLRSRGGF